MQVSGMVYRAAWMPSMSLVARPILRERPMLRSISRRVRPDPNSRFLMSCGTTSMPRQARRRKRAGYR